MTAGHFAPFVRAAAAAGRLVVQPRMGFADPGRMRAGLLAVRDARATTVGTVTLDSYTRVNNHAGAARALLQSQDLNGYPIVAHGSVMTAAMLEGLHGPDFPVQVRHGSAQPLGIFHALVDSGLDATEGGPVSYCLPYSRVPLRTAIGEWAACCELLAEAGRDGGGTHLESFAGCMLGQLAPPGLLVALSILEGLFFRHHGIASLSLSFAQQTHPGQDLDALRALRHLAGEFLSDVDWHVVAYTFMGLFPQTPAGAAAILQESVELAVRGGAERLIVKTAAEAFRIPTIEENVSALERAGHHAATVRPAASPEFRPADSPAYREARALVEAVLDLHPEPGEALARAFAAGLLDVPYCLHPDNANRARSRVAADGRLLWADPGRMPLPGVRGGHLEVGSADLLHMLTYNQRRFDDPSAATEAREPADGAAHAERN
ncbi:methylaspartate mutase [Couchioplanes azureus]|uniref:methylaspartate mutase n=1 Tax=Couchioplanes caeruleus TaxID=56438 RepID=UPI001670E779|nr:methylaspartate mutase [Couchioplanes caeruleus]GGQ69852.1 methylaspartate mutase [Couchioplanes caeruleus subsp. azureus]